MKRPPRRAPPEETTRQTKRDPAQLLGNFFGHFEVYCDVDVVADDYATAVDIGIPLHAVILAVDLGSGAGGDTGVAPGIFDGVRRAFDVENRFLGDPVNGEIASNFEFSGRDVFDFFGFESDGRIFGDVEELLALEVFVAHGFAGVYGSGVNGDVDGGFANVLIIPGDGAGDALELATHGGNHEVLDGKTSGSMSGIDRPDSGSRGSGERYRGSESCGE